MSGFLRWKPIDIDNPQGGCKFAHCFGTGLPLASIGFFEGQLAGAATASGNSPLGYLRRYLRRAPQAMQCSNLHHTGSPGRVRGELEAAEGGAGCIRLCGGDLPSAAFLCLVKARSGLSYLPAHSTQGWRNLWQCCGLSIPRVDDGAWQP